jgi:ATP-dependent exoDNAse (exonuclease V) beta subunit
LSDPAKKTIAILVRARGHLFEIAPRLTAAGRRFRAVEIEQLGHRPVVQDLLALTRALVHPGDRLAWLAVLRAPWCGLTLVDLEALAGGREDVSVWELMQQEPRWASLSADGGARLARMQAVMNTCLGQRRRGSLRRRVEGAWLALGGPACVDDQTDLADAQVYLDALAALEAGADMADLAALEERVAALYALPDVGADERLQLMTIHKAKGLEFDTVIVPGLDRQPPPSEPSLLLWHERPNPRTDDVQGRTNPGPRGRRVGPAGDVQGRTNPGPRVHWHTPRCTQHRPAGAALGPAPRPGPTGAPAHVAAFVRESSA